MFLVQGVSRIGGSERQSLALARALAARGVAVRVLSLTDGVEARRWLGDAWAVDQDRVRVHCLPRVAFESFASLLLARWSAGFDALYAVGSMMGAIAVRLGRVHGVPVVVKFAGSGPSGDVASLISLEPRLRREVQQDLATASLVCLTEHMEREVLEFGFPTTCVTRIPNGVVVTNGVAPARPAGDRPTVLFAGRLAWVKGPSVLVDAFPQVRERVPTAALLLAGPGDEIEELRAQADALGLSDSARLLGPRSDVAELLAGATVCAVPSRDEGMSNTLLEALAAGTPVVASDIPANREVLGADAGLLVPPSDPAALAQALVRVLTEPDLRTRLVAAGRERATAFDLDGVADAYLDLFNRQQATRRPGPLRLAGRFLRARAADVTRRLS